MMPLIELDKFVSKMDIYLVVKNDQWEFSCLKTKNVGCCMFFLVS